MAEYRKQLWELIEKKKNAFIADYELQLAERRSKEAESLEDIEHDELAEQAMGVLQENS